MTNCPKCNSTNFTITPATLDGEVVYRIFECFDCRQAAFEKMLSEVKSNVATRYSKTKLRTDYYGTVTIKDLK